LPLELSQEPSNARPATGATAFGCVLSKEKPPPNRWQGFHLPNVGAD
jgi:hypothetical protein